MSVDWGDILPRYGYLAVLVGTFFEGESILIAGALAAHGGLLRLPGVLGAALLGSFLADQMFFVLGRRLGRPWLVTRPRWQHRALRVYGLLARHDALFILGFRFLYGLRSISPFIVGTSTLPAPRFFMLNFCGALLWTCSVGGLGYCMGDVWAAVPPGSITGWRVAAVAVALTAVLWARRRWQHRRAARPAQR